MTDSTLRRLAESKNFLLAHSFESVVVIDKRDGSTRDAGDHYGDPVAGLITPDERWYVSAGEGVQCFSAEGTLLTFFRRGTPPLGPESAMPAWFVSSVNLNAAQTLIVTFEPNDCDAPEWAIDLDTATVTKLR
jgi:hypothetical protein